MNRTLQLFFLVVLLIFGLNLFRCLKKQKLNLKYSLVWLFSLGTLIILVLCPPIVELLGSVVGIAAPTSTTFVFSGIFMLLIIFTLTIIVSELTDKIYTITQQLALLKNRLCELEKICASIHNEDNIKDKFSSCTDKEICKDNTGVESASLLDEYHS